MKDVWDIHVPGTNCYFAAGVLHHNSGKSAGGSVAYAEYLRDDAPPNTEHLCVTTDQRLSRKNQQKMLWDLIPHEMFDVEWSGPKNGFGSINPVVTIDKRTDANPNGRNVIVHFMTQTEYENNSDAFEGLTIETAWIDEAISHELFSAVSARCSLSDDGRILVTAIPGADWFHETIYNAKKEDRVWFKLFEPFDNPTMTEEKWRRFESRVPPHERDVRIRGIPAMAGAVVYTEFDRRYREEGGHLVRRSDVPEDVVWYAGQDIGMDHPTVVLFVAIDRDGRMWIADEYVARNTTIETDVQNLKAMMGSRVLKMPAAIDPAAFQITKANQTSPAMQYIKHGWPVRKALRTSDYGERAMVFRIKEMFAHGEIFVCDNCQETIRELCVWKYRRDQQNRPITTGSPFEDRNNDACLAPWTEVLTTSGWKKISELEGTQGFIWTPLGMSWYDACVRTRKNADIYRIKTGTTEVFATDNHWFLTTSGWRQVADIEEGDILCGPRSDLTYEADVQRKALLPLRAVLPAHATSGCETEAQESEVASSASGRMDVQPWRDWRGMGDSPQGREPIEQRVEQSATHSGSETSPASFPEPKEPGEGEGAYRKDSSAGVGMARIGRWPGVPQEAWQRVVEERDVPNGQVLPVRGGVSDARSSQAQSKVLWPALPERSQVGKGAFGVPEPSKAYHSMRLVWEQLRGEAKKRQVLHSRMRRKVSEQQVIEKTYAGTSDVFDLHVPGVHCFTVKGGLVAHNCDALRYLVSMNPTYERQLVEVVSDD